MDPMDGMRRSRMRRDGRGSTLQVLSIVGGIAALSDFGAHFRPALFIVLDGSSWCTLQRLVAEKNL